MKLFDFKDIMAFGSFMIQFLMLINSIHQQNINYGNPFSIHCRRYEKASFPYSYFAIVNTYSSCKRLLSYYLIQHSKNKTSIISPLFQFSISINADRRPPFPPPVPDFLFPKKFPQQPPSIKGFDPAFQHPSLIQHNQTVTELLPETNCTVVQVFPVKRHSIHSETRLIRQQPFKIVVGVSTQDAGNLGFPNQLQKFPAAFHR